MKHQGQRFTVQELAGPRCTTLEPLSTCIGSSPACGVPIVDPCLDTYFSQTSSTRQLTLWVFRALRGCRGSLSHLLVEVLAWVPAYRSQRSQHVLGGLASAYLHAHPQDRNPTITCPTAYRLHRAYIGLLNRMSRPSSLLRALMPHNDWPIKHTHIRLDVSATARTHLQS